MMLHSQQDRHVAVSALLVAMCIALSAILAPAPLAAAAAATDISSAGATLGTTSATDAVGGAAAATLAPAPTTTPPASGDDVLPDTIRNLCRNRSAENRDSKCSSVLGAACAALDAKANAGLSDLTSSTVDLREVAGHVLSGLDPASRARTTACFLALPDTKGSRECRYSIKKEWQKNRKKAMALAHSRLVTMCRPDIGYDFFIPACQDIDAIRSRKCLASFRQGKTTFQESSERKEEVDVEALLHPGKSFTTTKTRSTTHTFDCCSAGLSDRCLCDLKKKLGNNTSVGVPCLEKKELQVCK